ncbi:MAG: adenylate/guanylate cyclase domain-containing protein [Breznakibacter sp.]
MKILIADDMQIIAELIASLLEGLSDDIEYLFATNGKEACKLALNESPDLIIMDWEMPEMNGIDALTRIKRNELTQDIPILISSAFSDSESIYKALQAGAIDYIRKPIDSVELIARVRSALTLSSAFHKLKEQTYLLNEERARSEQILRGYLPEELVYEITHQGFSKPQRYKNVSILFADLVDFTTNTTCMSAKRLFDELNDIFPAFDKITRHNRCIKIKTIGDAYLAACGLPKPNENHALHVAQLAIEMRNYIAERNKVNPFKWKIRIGISLGNVFAGLIGKDFFHFDVFGDTINTAARMQQYTAPMQINLSEETSKLISAHYKTIERVPIQVKGKGEKRMFYLHRPVNAFDGWDDFGAHPLRGSLF